MVVKNRLLVCWNEELETWNCGLCAWPDGRFCYSRSGEQDRLGENSSDTKPGIGRASRSGE